MFRRLGATGGRALQAFLIAAGALVALLISVYASRQDARKARWRPGKLPGRQLIPVIGIDALAVLLVYGIATTLKEAGISYAIHKGWLTEGLGVAVVSIATTAISCGLAGLALLGRNHRLVFKTVTEWRQSALQEITSAMARSESKDHRHRAVPALARWDTTELVDRVRHWCDLSEVARETQKLIVKCAKEVDTVSRLALCGHLYKLQDKNGPKFLDQLIDEAPLLPAATARATRPNVPPAV